VGRLQGEFLSIHPFREGNALAIKLVSDLIAAQGGRPVLRYDQNAEGTESYIRAASAALTKKDYAPMTATIREALRAAMAD
jgi:cell filamentation protein